MGLRPTHGDESALLRFIDSKQGYSRLSRECNGDVTTVDPTLGENATASSLPNGLSSRVKQQADSYERLRGCPSGAGTKQPKRPTYVARKAVPPRSTLFGRLPRQDQPDCHPAQRRRRLRYRTARLQNP